MNGKFQPRDLVYNRNTTEDGAIRKVYETHGATMYEVAVPMHGDAWASGFCISDWAEDALQLSDNVRLKSATLAVPETLRPGLTTSERQQALGAAREIADVLRNGVTMPAHGPAEMPTWGADFREMDGLDVTQVKLRIANLTSYIKSRQLKQDGRTEYK